MLLTNLVEGREVLLRVEKVGKPGFAQQVNPARKRVPHQYLMKFRFRRGQQGLSFVLPL